MAAGFLTDSGLVNFYYVFKKNVTLFESMLEKVFLASLTKIILKNRFLMILASAYPIHIRSSSRVENSDGGTFIVGIARCMTESRLSSKIQKISSTLQLHLDSNYAWMHYKEKQRQIHITTYILTCSAKLWGYDEEIQKSRDDL